MKAVIKWIINDIRTDIQALREMPSEEGKRRFNKIVEGFSQLTLKDLFCKENVMWFLIVILAFICGSMISAAYYNSQVTKYVYNAVDLARSKGLNISAQDILEHEPKPYYYHLHSTLPLINISDHPINKPTPNSQNNRKQYIPYPAWNTD